MGDRQNIILIVILLLSAYLRLWNLSNAPASLYWEEVAIGYDAYSILKTGKDHHGNVLPLISFESFGDYKPSGYFYLTIPMVAIFGLNEWSVRLPSSLAGIFSVYLMYRLGLLLQFKKSTALWAAFILAIMPWHIQFSRAAFEVNAATTMLLLGITLWLSSKQRPWLLLLSTLILAASMYTYHGLRILAPLFGIYLVIRTIKQYRISKWLIMSIVMAILTTLPLLMAISSPTVSQRFRETSLFSTSNAVIETNRLRAEDGNNLISRIIHHRYSYWLEEIARGMLSHLSPGFLWLHGDQNLRHQTGFRALLLYSMAIPLLFLAFKKKHHASLPFILIWIVLASIPPALTNLTPHTLRFLPAAPAFAFLIALGIDSISSTLLRKLLVLVMIMETALFFYDYHTRYVITSSQEWQYGYRQVIEIIEKQIYKDAPVYFTRSYGRPAMYTLFYNRYSPATLHVITPGLGRDQGELLEFDRYHFGPVSGSENGLLISDSPLPNKTPIEIITFLDNNPGFYIYDNR